MSQRDIHLLRLLHGELSADEVARIGREMARDETLEARYRVLEGIWDRLEEPQAEAVPPWFAPRVVAEFERLVEVRCAIRWSSAPLWVRATATCALVVGVLLGTMVGVQRETMAWDDVLSSEPTLAESYWLDFENASAEVTR